MNLVIKPIETLTQILQEFIQKVITPPLEEVGLLFADHIKYWRLKNQVKIVEKAELFLKDNNIKTQKVSLKVLAPLLDAASFEEDESLQEKWAALLVHTVEMGSKANTTLYSSILRQLTNEDAEIFEYVYTVFIGGHSLRNGLFTEKRIIRVNRDKVLTVDDSLEKYNHYSEFGNFYIVLDNLIRLRLITEIQTTGDGLSMITVSDLGTRFMALCKFE